MDNTSKQSSPWKKIFKNTKRRSTSLDKSEVNSPSSSGLARHRASNIDGTDKLGLILIHNDLPNSSTLNDQSIVSISPSGDSSYGELIERIQATIDRLTLKANNPEKDLFNEIQNILICFKLLDKVPELADQLCLLINSHMEYESNYWKEVRESMKPKLSTFKRFKNLALSVLGSGGDRPSVKKINIDGELIHKYLRAKQKLIDRTLTILWCKIGREYALTCKNLLIRIAYNMDYFLPGDKDCAEVIVKTDQFFDLTEKFEKNFKKLYEAFETMDSIVQNNSEINYSYLNPESSMNESRTSVDIQAQPQDSYEALIQKRKKLKQDVEALSAPIKKIIYQVGSVTIDKLTKVVEKFIQQEYH